MAKIEINFMSTSLNREVSVIAFLPTDFSALFPVEKPYRTVYVLPGYSAGKEQLATFLPLRSECEMKGLAVIIPDGDNSFYQDVPSRHANYSSYISKELVEFTRSILPLSTKREDTYIAGISMGGYGALYNGLTNPQTFSKIAAFSPGIDLYELPDIAGVTPSVLDNYFGSEEVYKSGDTDISSAFLKQRDLPELFIGCGRQDALAWEMNRRFHDSLCEAGIAHEWMELDGNHDFYTWTSMMDRAFSFLAGIEAGTRDKFAL